MAAAVSRDMSRTAYPGGRSLRGSNSQTVKSSVNGLYAAATASADASTLCTASPGRITKGRGLFPNRTQSISKASVPTVWMSIVSCPSGGRGCQRKSFSKPSRA